ncbi:uncharacterized protein PHALS_02681 [Plasmopara halstedii]|uniref:Uncharacterized protein n=1 Tax=Plasmopara halstedii TaxID=4781 RepID=A0A0P1AYN3_PLAHL|nr:uncharacterized protein PHALS_02681 [Plasmopara halstedii]CEG46270.1 hypothetical protein PHALS_02681 [Plasmopara halstedii]|eukprot:XP_024582639.1 hypothetical protein PHALS_02681 [Plasmopara halstedii]
MNAVKNDLIVRYSVSSQSLSAGVVVADSDPKTMLRLDKFFIATLCSFNYLNPSFLALFLLERAFG